MKTITLIGLFLLMIFAAATLNKPSDVQLAGESAVAVHDKFAVEITNFNSTNLSVEVKITNLGRETASPKDYELAGWTTDNTDNMETLSCSLPDINLLSGESIQWTYTDRFWANSNQPANVRAAKITHEQGNWNKTSFIIGYNDRSNHIAYYDVATGKNRKPTKLEYYS